MTSLPLDLIQAVRNLTKNPGYAAVAILLFALGIGANTAIFSVANAVLLRPLPYADPEHLVVALHEGVAPVSPADFIDYKASVHAFEQLGAAQGWGGTVVIGDRREQIPGLQLTPNMIALLGVLPMLGRGLAEPTDLLLSYVLWKDRFAADPAIVGRTISIDRTTYTVAGVMPADFRFAPFWITRAQMWSVLDLERRKDDRDGRSLRVFGWLKPNVSLLQAQAEMDAVAAHLAEQYPQTNAKLAIRVVPLREKVVSSVRPTLLALLGTVGFVLLIACATVGNLMLSRAVGRRREMALRQAVGARRRDLIRITMAEILVLALMGAAGGLVLGGWSLHLLSGMLPAGSIPRQAELGFDQTALLFGAAVALLSALLAGILPSIQATRANLNTDLRESSKGSTQSGHLRRWQSTLIAAEVALSLVLLAGAGLMMRTMLELTSLDGGFNPHNLLTLQVSISGTDYDQAGRRAAIFEETRERLAQNPKVESVSGINHLPLGGDTWQLAYTIEGRPKPLPGERQGAVYRVSMPGYLQTMQIGLVAGRDFLPQDRQVALINEAMARHQWPSGETPIGKVIHFGLTKDDQKIPRTVIGVVRNARQGDWTSNPGDEIYLPYLERADAMGLSYLTFTIRTRTAGPEGIVRDLRAFNKSLTISEIAPMERIIRDELWRQRLAAALMGAFALVALVLAATGIYGVISHSMRQRAQEMGIRMALGARPVDLVGLALWEGMKPVLGGMLAGAMGAVFLGRFLETLVYGVQVRDAATFGSISLLLLVVSIAANVIPAVRAARIDSVTALVGG